MLSKRRDRKRGEYFEVDYHTTGPSYASAYGLVAAYHRKYYRSPDGKIQIGGDEGIRTHGSVDYMSIMRRHSHGCHRMHNHIAVRLMSFVLEHRPHTRYGQQPMVYRREFEFEEELYLMEFDKGGYNFVLEEPLFVETPARKSSRPSQRADRGRVAALRPGSGRVRDAGWRVGDGRPLRQHDSAHQAVRFRRAARSAPELIGRAQTR